MEGRFKAASGKLQVVWVTAKIIKYAKIIKQLDYQTDYLTDYARLSNSQEQIMLDYQTAKIIKYAYKYWCSWDDLLAPHSIGILTLLRKFKIFSVIDVTLFENR